MDGETARDQGIERVQQNSPAFKVSVQAFVDSLPQGWCGTAEDFRLLYLTYPWLPKPHHPNCWGAATMNAVRRGALINTGSRVKPKDVPSHARKIDVYVRP